MTSKERRERILKTLLATKEPKKGQDLGEEMGVTRQVIVKDIAILRAEGNNIIATPDGYIITSAQPNKVKRIIAVCHNESQMEDELRTIVKYGATVEDVIVEHPLYGEMRGMLMVKTIKDVENFVERFYKDNAQPLSRLRDGVHMHTVVADSQEVIDNLLMELGEKGYLACD